MIQNRNMLVFAFSTLFVLLALFAIFRENLGIERFAIFALLISLSVLVLTYHERFEKQITNISRGIIFLVFLIFSLAIYVTFSGMPINATSGICSLSSSFNSDVSFGECYGNRLSELGPQICNDFRAKNTLREYYACHAGLELSGIQNACDNIDFGIDTEMLIEECKSYLSSRR